MNPNVLPSKDIDLLLAMKVSFYEAYNEEYTSSPAYTDYKKLVKIFPGDFDEETILYPSPMGGMKEWIGERPFSQLDWDFFRVDVRKFADGIFVDVDDAKSSRKRPLIIQAVRQLAIATALWEPSLVAEAIVGGLTKVWKPDGQKIWDVHNFDPRDASKGSARNYYANNVQGGNAAKALNYANLKAGLEQGYTYKLPNGKSYTARFNQLVVGSALVPTARTLTTVDNFVVGGVLQPNEIKPYGLEIVELADMPANHWMLHDARTPNTKSIGVKIAQPVTWQQIGAFPDGDSGDVPEEVYERNRTKYGPKAVGEAFFQNWWSAILFDGTP